VRKVLVVRLRSIGDTVLATPSLLALKRFLPNTQIDILVEDWVAPVLDNHPHVDNVIVLERGGLMARARVARELRAANYDVVYNLPRWHDRDISHARNGCASSRRLQVVSVRTTS
jgi:ADP-heptose:LPS heptosyltransferase